MSDSDAIAVHFVHRNYTRDMVLTELFDEETAFTAWLVEHDFALGLEVVPDFTSGAMGEHQVAVPTGTADIVLRDLGGQVIVVVEVQFGPADRSHCQRLVGDYMGALHPRLGVLICERWRPELETILHNSIQPVLVREAHVLLIDSDPMAFAVQLDEVYRHDPVPYSR